jgi:hypothetical protein
MIRTVWLAAFCLAGLGGLYASKVAASISSSEGGTAAPAIISAGVVPDTLTSADKLDLTNLRPTAEVTLAQPPVPAIMRLGRARRMIPLRSLQRQAGTKTKVIAPLPKSRPKFRLSRNGKAPKLAAKQMKCAETNGLGRLIILLTGTTHCS